MKATHADSRVIGRQTDHPAYWVIYRDAAGARAEEYRLTDVRNVHEALAWAELNARSRRFDVFAEATDGEDRHVVRLVGHRPHG